MWTGDPCSHLRAASQSTDEQMVDQGGWRTTRRAHG